MKKIKILLVCALLTASVVNAAEVSETKTAIKNLPADSIDIIEPEEYEVYVAVFDAKKLDGIPFGYVVLERETLKEKMRKDGWKDTDTFMVDDFNRKNEKAHVLENKFPSEYRGLTIKVRENVHNGKSILNWNKEPASLDSGRTSVSRVGFNKEKTKALVYVQHVASPEMGVGHYVTLQKINNKWMVVSSGIGKIF